MSRKKSYIVTVSFLLLVLIASTGSAPGRSINSATAKITIDPGHGGYDPGAIVAGVSEKKVNLAIARRLKVLGKKHPSLDFVFTRTSDTYLSPLERLEFAENQGSDGYISIHVNSFSDPDVRGVATILDRSRPKEGRSWEVAKLVQESVASMVGTRDRGLRYQRLYTRHTKIPAALVEVGFLTSPVGRERLTSRSYQEKIARGIIQGLLRYQN